VDWTGTPCLLVRREDFFSVGGFPEDFYYWHESVFCHRLIRLGRETWIVPSAKVVHFEGQGGGVRPYAVRRWHIIDFSQGAYRFHCERRSLGRWHPSRWLTGASLAFRAGALLTLLWLKTRREKTAQYGTEHRYPVNYEPLRYRVRCFPLRHAGPDHQYDAVRKLSQ